MNEKILSIVREDSRYDYHAYEFVSEAVTFTQELLGRIPDEDDDPHTDYHVSAAELARGACENALLQFGMMAPVVFRQWGLRTTDDIGRVVFNLIRAGLLCQSERDEIEDFHDLFDMDKALAEGYELTANDAKGGSDR